jgi:hypothetical protein
VAESKSTLQQIGLTRGKAALIGVLAVALVGVVYRQYGGSDAGQKSASSATTNQQSPALSPLPAAGSPLAAGGPPVDAGVQVALAEFDQTKWQSPDLKKVIAYDPFALPSTFPQPVRAVLDPTLATAGGDASSAALAAQQLADAVAQMQSQLADLQQRGVHVIVNLNDEYVAMIGDRTIHVGDEINGFIVTAIEPDGVRVERKAVQ